MSYAIVALRYRPDLQDAAADWFCQTWGRPLDACRSSINACLAGARVPQWYLALEGDRIVGGCGVIENDAHNRRDLTPNLCALYAEEQDIEGDLLNAVCTDMASMGIRTLYLLTDREGRFESYGWRYFCPAEREWTAASTRLYVHRQPLVLHGSGPDRTQLHRVYKAAQPARWLWAAVWVLSAIMGMAALGIAGYADGGMLGMTVPALLIALGLGILGSLRIGAARRKEEQNAWLLSQAEGSAGLTARIYSDRAEQRSSCWGERIPLDENARLTEYRDLLVLERGEQRILLRGEDLTPAQAAEALGLIGAALPPENRLAAESFTGTRTAAAPPPFKTDTPLCFEQVPARYHPPAPDLWGIGASAAGAALLCAALLTAAYAITPWALLDLLIFFGATGAAAAGLTVLLFLLMKRRGETRATLSFTGAGLGVTKNGAHRFVAPANVSASRTGNGARLRTPAGEYTFSWTDVKNRQQLEWMLFH